jgi:hypothetical protein
LVRQSDGAIEVIKIAIHDGASDLIATIVRDIQGVHGGVGLAFIIGDVVDVRIPSEALDTFLQHNPNNPAAGAASLQWLRDLAPGAQGVSRSVAIGPGTLVEGGRSPGGDDCVVIGHNARVTEDTIGRSTIIGSAALSGGRDVVGIGYQANPVGQGCISIGSGSRASGLQAITIGEQTNITNDECIWLGANGLSTFGDGLGIIAIGHDLDVTPGTGNNDGIIIGRGVPGKRPGGDSFVTTRPITMNISGDINSTGKSVVNSGAEVIVATGLINLKNASPFEPLSPNVFHQFDFGPNGVFFVESLEMWVTVVFGPAISQAPAVKIGSTQGSSNILAAHTFGTTFGSNTRERVSPTLLPDSGFNSIWIEITQPAIGPTVMQGAYLIRGTLYDQA